MFASIFKLFGCGDKNSKPTDPIQQFRQNVKENSVLTKQMLEATTDDKLEETIIANINSKLDKDLSNAKDVLPTLSKERQSIYYIYLLETEVNNGGFDQYYLNKFFVNYGDYMFDKKNEALKTIGATKFADLVQQADKIYKANKKDFDRRINMFEDLDKEFQETYKKENLHDLRAKFIRNNLAAFTDIE